MSRIHRIPSFPSRSLSSGAVFLLICLISGVHAFASPRENTVTLNLQGLTLASGSDITLSSSPNALVVAPVYSYKLQGTVHGVGVALPVIFPDPTDIATAFETVKAGSSKLLAGTVNAPDHFPVSIATQVVNGSSNGFHISFTFEEHADSNGFVVFTATNVSFSSPLGAITDSIVFDAGSTFTVSVMFTPPTVTGGAVSGVTATSATVNGTVDQMGDTGVSYFEYGLTPSYSSTTAAVQATGSSAPVSATITGLAAHTTYHYRLTGSNSGGVTQGKDLTFTTAYVSPLAVSSYDGLVVTGSGNVVGYLKGTVSAKGVFTGTLKLDAASHPVMGSLVLSGSFSETILRGAGTPLVVNLAVTAKDGASTLGGTITGDAVPLKITAVEVPFAVKNPSPDAGLYTALIPPPRTSGTSLPGGTGYAKITIGAAGGVTISGALGDGTPWISAGMVKKDGSINVFSPLYGTTLATQGLLAGTIQVVGTGGQRTLAGNLAWGKLPTTKAKAIYAAGFVTPVTLVGSLYVATKPVTLVNDIPVDLQNAIITGTGGNLGGVVVTGTMTINSASKITVQAPMDDKLTITIAPASGGFSGGFEDVANKKHRLYHGVFLQSQGKAGGVFVGDTASGGVVITPRI